MPPYAPALALGLRDLEDALPADAFRFDAPALANVFQRLTAGALEAHQDQREAVVGRRLGDFGCPRRAESVSSRLGSPMPVSGWPRSGWYRRGGASAWTIYFPGGGELWPSVRRRAPAYASGALHFRGNSRAQILVVDIRPDLPDHYERMLDIKVDNSFVGVDSPVEAFAESYAT